ncbi:MAG: phosphatidylserine decarboxylase [Ghiorsea sp.]
MTTHSSQTPSKPDAGNPRGAIPIAPEGYPFLAVSLIVALALCCLGFCTLAAIAGMVFLFILHFFRDFDQDTPMGDDLYICPANGKVINAETTDAGSRINIFMNVFDAHVNRAPMTGRITNMEYTEGKFMNASFERACDENERNRFELTTDDGIKLSFTQISGLLARRIVSYVAVGDQVEVGQRIGMIRFGSRVDNVLPADFELCVNVGDKVVAGKTILARRKIAAVETPKRTEATETVATDTVEVTS